MNVHCIIIHCTYMYIYLQSNAVSPTITQSPVDITIIEGNNAVFVCQASALPRPAINWDYYDPVSNSTSRVMDGADYEIVEAMDGDRVLTSIFTVLSTDVSDFGEYRCTAINVVGVVSATASLSVYGELYMDIYPLINVCVIQQFTKISLQIIILLAINI